MFHAQVTRTHFNSLLSDNYCVLLERKKMLIILVHYIYNAIIMSQLINF